MSTFKFKTILLLSIFSPFVTYADSDLQTWNSINLKAKSESISYGIELESRISESSVENNRRQIKPEVFQKLRFGKVGFIYTYESGGLYNRKTENRYSFAYDIVSLKTDTFKVSTRFRQEFRNFAGKEDLAYRFRFRNNIELNAPLIWKLKPLLSSEWRIYEKNSAGKSPENFSHRTIVALRRSFGVYTLALHYTHNLQKKTEDDQNTNAFGLKLSVKI